MPVTLSEVPPPSFSDGTVAFYPDVYRSSRAPAGGYVECQHNRVQKYLELLTPVLKDAYERYPNRIPGIERLAPAQWDGTVVFRGPAVLTDLPQNFKMFESRKVEQPTDSAAGTPGAASPAPGEGTPTPLKKEGDGKKSGTKTSKPRADAYIFGHPSGSKFRSTTEFMPHLAWLVSDETHKASNCLCKLCQNWTKAGGKPFARGKVIAPSANTIVPTSTPTSAPNPVTSPTIPSPREAPTARKKTPTKLQSLLSDEPAPPRDPSETREPDYAPPPSSGLHTPQPVSRPESDVDNREDHEAKAGRPLQSKSKKDDRGDPLADANYKKKYRELKHKIGEVEEETDKLEQEYAIAKKRLSRLKFERQYVVRRNLIGLAMPVLTLATSSGFMALTQYLQMSDSNDARSVSGESRSPPDSQQPPLKRQRKKREKKIIDPDAPRRPANAFMFFCDQNRELLKKERGTMREADIKSQGLSNLTKALGARWKALDAAQRQEWGQKFKSEVKRFEGEMADYTEEKSRKRKLDSMDEPAPPAVHTDTPTAIADIDTHSLPVTEDAHYPGPGENHHIPQTNFADH
ncbi:hypothetical protein HDU86_001712 [Geranomyces michiganensis]|nr:hypothetical protein HDU86_001712 [Geranomyces michiganensis]